MAATTPGQWYAHLLQAEGGVVSAEQAATVLRMTRQGVDKRRRTGALIGLSLGRKGYVYPLWQFSQNGTLPGLEAVMSELRHASPIVAINVLYTQVACEITAPPYTFIRTFLSKLKREVGEAST